MVLTFLTLTTGVSAWSYTPKHYSKDFHTDEFVVTSSMLERSQSPYWEKNPLPLKNTSDQTVKKWEHGTKAQVDLGETTEPKDRT